MPDVQHSTDSLLISILSVLERIDNQLTVQHVQTEKLEKLIQFNSSKIGGYDSESHISVAAPSINSQEVNKIRPVLPLNLSRHNVTDYREWGPQVQFDENMSKLVESYLGDWWHLPDDGRLPLSFPNSDQQAMITWGSGESAVRRKLEAAVQFDRELRSFPGNDFLIVDFDSRNNHIIYRLGAKAIGKELNLDATQKHERDSAPWSRLMCVPLISILLSI